MKRRLWSKSFGERGAKVRLYTDARSGLLYGEVRFKGRDRRAALGHRDRDRATTWAKAQLAELLAGRSALADPTPYAARVFSLYLAHRTPKKSPASQAEDKRRVTLWTAVLGARKDLSKLTRGEWETFLEARQSGAITATGEAVPLVPPPPSSPQTGEAVAKPVLRAPVRNTSANEDAAWLRWVIGWATTWQDADGVYLMRENPARGFTLLDKQDRRRPVASQDRFEAIRRVADRITMEVLRDHKCQNVPSYLPELLDIVNGTGRRISAVLRLTYADLRFDTGKHGSIAWPADTDKMGKAWLTPVSAPVRTALDRVMHERPGLGRAYLFPSPRHADQPVSKDLASAWLERAERLADVPKQDGSLWHAYRRKWATERKHLPDRDVAAAGGWSDLSCLKACYQQVDERTLFRVVTEPAELREWHG